VPGGQTFICVFFATADFARRISSLRESEVVEQAVHQLEEIFPSVTGAHSILSGYLYKDWLKERFIRQGYSSYGREQSPLDVLEYARPVQSQVFFAGEAACPRAGLTVHAAMETGLQVSATVASLIVSRYPPTRSPSSSMVAKL
jgi:monoamine oxidase